MSFPDIIPDLNSSMPQLRGQLLANQTLGEFTWFRVGGPAPGDRVDDGEVLGERAPRPSGPQRDLELVADELRVQPLQQADRDVLAGDFPHSPVHLVVEL